MLDLKEKCAVGFDQVSNTLLKRYLDILMTPITNICNLFFFTGQFPTAFKMALIKPIHKSGDRSCVNNYRPISILSTLSKILELLLNVRLIKFLEKNKILSSNQYGFLCGKSTSDAVL